MTADTCGYPDATTHPHIEQCHRAERAVVEEELRAARVEALRDAADEIDVYVPGACQTCEGNVLAAAEVWLRSRADWIAAGGDGS